MAGTRSMGTGLFYNSGTTVAPTWSKVANLTSIGEIGLETEEIDVTDLDSPNGFKEFIAGTKDAGSVDIAGNVVGDSNVTDLYGLANNGKVKEWKVEFPTLDAQTTAATWEFDAYVSAFKEGESTTDSLRTFTGSLRVSGAPTFTPGA